MGTLQLPGNIRLYQKLQSKKFTASSLQHAVHTADTLLKENKETIAAVDSRYFILSQKHSTIVADLSQFGVHGSHTA